ncbi:MAG: hypothetical protein IJC71_01785 [Clostridia bacterium]|nr:hypothetical protein [Clostridia bacterium]
MSGGALTGADVMTSLCREVRNYFVRRTDDKIAGTFTVSEGVLTLSGGDLRAETVSIMPGQYFRVIGSAFSDGVRQAPADGLALPLADETFTGEIWLMAPPPDFLQLADEIAAWCEKYSEMTTSPYASESFGGYTYTLRGTSKWRGDTSGTVTDVSWQNAFRRRLNHFRRMTV